ncbi:MAG TPA: DUF5060 domain-containing protein [Bryobacteraceae bacterium]|nr:DUF5060 domain-containing protein [Bryobacteraceae bacterium]
MLRWAILFTVPVWAQLPTCTVPAWSACDLAFDLEAAEDSPAVQLHGEFRSAKRTLLIRAFRDGDRRYLLRFAPTEPGEWVYRLTSSLKRLDGQLGKATATESASPGFVRAANVHHFANEGTNKQHLWMGTAIDDFTKIPRTDFDSAVAQRLGEKFTHLRVMISADTDLREAVERIRAINARGLVADVVLGGIPADRLQRERYMTDIVARCSALNITWMGAPAFERTPNGKAILKDAGTLLAKLDPYNHPRTSMAEATSSPLAGDQWLNVLSYGTSDPNVGAVEHQFFAMPALNTGIQSERDLWNATMNGQYPASGSGKYMTAWFDFMSGNRYWELEPYFDVDGGRALALEDVEYIVYVEKPGPVELTVEDHGYDVAWINPSTGERIKAKGYKGKHFTGEPPDKSHDWVLHVSREGHKEGMLKSWKFESRRVPVQEIETAPKNMPFEVAQPEGDISMALAPRYALKVVRPTRATRELLAEWTAEVVVDGEGYRVAGTGREGTLHIPKEIVHKLPAIVSVRVSILNANGKAYAIDKVYRLLP